ncbi:uncharacterized protein G2W53_044344 [Senna tora]|uniref:Uncharacterized protein n=1 Tax=Senna tora TaxID=362788 RepID=A0A834W101_9FABA|nr:uncharacterized protein G2W53_044344 [Senna tora]
MVVFTTSKAGISGNQANYVNSNPDRGYISVETLRFESIFYPISFAPTYFQADCGCTC